MGRNRLALIDRSRSICVCLGVDLRLNLRVHCYRSLRASVLVPQMRRGTGYRCGWCYSPRPTWTMWTTRTRWTHGISFAFLSVSGVRTIPPVAGDR